jgi:eukaryotic-like serine/threonine-protein kinase
MLLTLPHLLAGRYQLTRRLGEGSFAETYLATDPILQRQVAIKVLRDQYSGDHRAVRHFEQEAKAAAEVAHPNVVEVYSYGRETQTLFIVMEWVDGLNLKQLIRARAPLPIPEAVRLLQELLRGLGAIHRAGIIHRDVKPQNVLLTRQGTAKLSDFGIARGTLVSGLTETGMTVGTAAYMAPEQASGGRITAAVDLYAAGVILYELVTGQLPFAGEHPVQVMYRQVHEAVRRPRELAPGIPVGLEGVILRALAKGPEERYPTAEAMAAALGGEDPGEPTQVLTAMPSGNSSGNEQPTRRAGAIPPPPARAQAASAARSAELPWPALLTTAVLVLLGLGGLLVLASGGDNAGQPPTQTQAPTQGALRVLATSSPTPTPTPTATSLIDRYVAGRPLPAIGAVIPFVEGSQKEEFKGTDLDGAFDPVHLDSFPVGRIPENSALIFSRSSGFGSGTTRFEAGERSRNAVFIVIEAMDSGDGGSQPRFKSCSTTGSCGKVQAPSPARSRTALPGCFQTPHC